MENKKERYIATMIGSALGDSLGMVVEGWKKAQIQKYVGRVESLMDPVMVTDSDGELIIEDEFGKLKYYTKDFKKGMVTDDTILAIALAESIVDKGFVYIEDIAQRQAAELKKRMMPNGKVIGGFGRTTTDAFKNILSGVSGYHSGVKGGPGNAPSMKIHPLGLYMDARGEDITGLWHAEDIGKISHKNPSSITSGILQAYAVNALLNDVSIDDMLDTMLRYSFQKEFELFRKSDIIQKRSLTPELSWVRRNQNASNDEAHDRLGSSSNVCSSYPFTIFMFQKYWDDPYTGLVELVNYGGDCDTTGAMYGALAGAKNGVFYPTKMADELKDKEKLEGLAKKIYELRER